LSVNGGSWDTSGIGTALSILAAAGELPGCPGCCAEAATTEAIGKTTATAVPAKKRARRVLRIGLSPTIQGQCLSVTLAEQRDDDEAAIVKFCETPSVPAKREVTTW
jgi:hypothetical protein